MLKRGLMLILFMILSCSAYAATYYVAQDSAGSGDGSSYDNRMSVDDHNSGSFSPGDTIYLCDLITPRVIVPSSGSASNSIVYNGECNGHQGVLTAYSDYGALTISDRSHIIIDGIEIRDAKEGIMSQGNNNNILIRNCYIHDLTYRGIVFLNPTSGYASGSATNIVVGGAPGQGNEIKNVGEGTAGADVDFGGVVDGGVISYNHLWADKSNGNADDRGIDGIVLENSNDILIEYNTIHGHNDDYYPGDHHGKGENAIDMKHASNVIFRYNNCYGQHREANILVQWDSHDIDIYGNRIWNSGPDNDANVVVMDGVHCCGAPAKANPVRNVNIWSNIIYDGSRGIWISNCCDDYDHVDSVKIFNNVIAEHSITGIYVSSGISGSGHVIKNNVFYANDEDSPHNQIHIINSDYLGNGDLDNNRYYSSGSSTVRIGSTDYVIDSIPNQEPSGSEGDPGFVDGDAHDYRLDDTSLCIGTGQDLGSAHDDLLDPSTDWSATPPSVVMTQQGAEWNIGAYGYTDNGAQTCLGLSGHCCILPETCPGTSLGTYSDCSGTCCDQACEELLESCQSHNYRCCNSCESGPHPIYDDDCGSQVCCDECAYQEYAYAIIKTPSPPTIDGSLSEFSKADAIQITDSVTGASGTYRLMWDDSALYIAAEFSDTKLNAEHTQEDTYLWEDDSLEIMFDTLNNKGSSIQDDDYKFYVNVREIHADSQAYDLNWDSGLTYAVAVSGTVNSNSDTDTGYTVEAKIPWWVTPPVFGSDWGMNVVLNDRISTGTYSTQTQWSGKGLDFNSPDGWEDILFTHRADNNPQDGCIDMNELSAFIDLWKQNSVNIGELMEAVGLWKQGCS